jgi:hypothetical protein
MDPTGIRPMDERSVLASTGKSQDLSNVRRRGVPPAPADREPPNDCRLSSKRPRVMRSKVRAPPVCRRVGGKKGAEAPFELPAAIAAVVSVSSTHAITVATDAVAVPSVDRGRTDTTPRAADQSNALNVRSWRKWDERHCGRDSCRSKAAECSKSNKRKFEFHVSNLEHATQ